MEFVWDDNKAQRNLTKHGVRFTEAITIWLDGCALEIKDEMHSEKEERWIRIGFSQYARILVVVYVEKIEGEVLRIISARKATKKEQVCYEQRKYL